VRLGYLAELTEQECRTAAQIGYDCIEAKINWELKELEKPDFRKAQADRMRGLVEEHGLSISAVADYRPSAESPELRIRRYRADIALCEELEVGVLTTLTGGDPEKDLEGNLDYFEAVFFDVAAAAEEAGVRIAFENWPGIRIGFPPLKTTNFGFNPDAWSQMFDRVDSAALGLEFDPSHLVWQGIDWPGALKEWAPRVYHVHAKDTELFRDRLASGGFFSAGWWRYRLPGYGCVDWHKFTSMLKEAGYDGGICVEHEDPVFSGPRREEGLLKAYEFLRPLV